MIKKLGTNSFKGGNIAKVKYFLHSGKYQNNQPKSASKIKKGSSTQSFLTSKNQSKMVSRRPSSSNNQDKIQQLTVQQQQLSFEILGISQAPSYNYSYNMNVSQINVSQIKAVPLGYEQSVKQKSRNKIPPLGQLIQNQIKNKFLKPQKIKVSQITKNKNFQTNFNVMTQELSNRKLSCEQITNMVKQFPNQNQKQQFMKFVEQLKHDQNYQNTISMFTIMYFYESKQKSANKFSYR